MVISFECTSGKRKAGSPWVEQMIGKHQRLPTHRLILISESGFTRPALAAADAAKDVEVATFAKATDVNWAACAERYERRRLRGFELKPIRMEVHWQPNAGSAGAQFTLERPTAFRKVETGQELNGPDFALDILRNPEVGRTVADRYFGDTKIAGVRGSAGAEALGAEAQIDVKWQPTDATWEIRFEHTTCQLETVVITAKVYIRDTPLMFSYKSLMGTQVAHTTVRRPFTNIRSNDRILIPHPAVFDPKQAPC